MPSRVSLRSRLGEALWVFLYRTGILRLGLSLVRWRGGGATRVLCYHRIADAPRPEDLSPERFRRHLDHLRRHYRFIAAADLVETVRGGGDLPRDAIVITVDDGYRDFPEETVAGLAEARATVFVLTAALPGRGRFPDEPGAPETLDAEDIARLMDRGVAIGSHSRNHARLTDLAPDELAADLLDSRAALPGPPDLVAYPWGLADEEVQAAAREAGYVGGFMTGGAPVRWGVDPLGIPRIHVPGGASVARLACEAAGLVSWLRGIR